MRNPQHTRPSSLRQDEVTTDTPAAAPAALLSSSPSPIDGIAAAATTPNDAEEEGMIELEYKGGCPKVDTYLYPPNQKQHTEPFTKNKKKQQHQHKRQSPSPTLWEILAGRVGPYLLVIPPTVTAIDDDACRGCTGLRGVQFHPQVTYIGYRAFYKKHQLRFQQLPYHVLRIEEKAFSHCRAVVDLTIPPYVQGIEYEAFAWCTSLQRVRFETLVVRRAASSATTLSATTATTITTLSSTVRLRLHAGIFANCVQLQSLLMPPELHVTALPQKFCYNCVALVEITIPLSVTWIHEAAFQNCKTLRSIELLLRLPPSSSAAMSKNITTTTTAPVTTLRRQKQQHPKYSYQIDSFAFANCRALERFTIRGRDDGNGFASSITTTFTLILGKHILQNCPALRVLDCPKVWWPQIVESMQASPEFIFRFLQQHNTKLY